MCVCISSLAMCAMCLCDQNIALAIVILPYLVHILHTLAGGIFVSSSARVIEVMPPKCWRFWRSVSSALPTDRHAPNTHKTQKQRHNHTNDAVCCCRWCDGFGCSVVGWLFTGSYQFRAMLLNRLFDCGVSAASVACRAHMT